METNVTLLLCTAQDLPALKTLHDSPPGKVHSQYEEERNGWGGSQAQGAGCLDIMSEVLDSHTWVQEQGRNMEDL
jgi:hypothetical protein